MTFPLNEACFEKAVAVLICRANWVMVSTRSHSKLLMVSTRSHSKLRNGKHEVTQQTANAEPEVMRSPCMQWEVDRVISQSADNNHR